MIFFSRWNAPEHQARQCHRGGAAWLIRAAAQARSARRLSRGERGTSRSLAPRLL